MKAIDEDEVILINNKTVQATTKAKETENMKKMNTSVREQNISVKVTRDENENNNSVYCAKKYICIICAKPFSTKQNRLRHMQGQDGQQPVSCQICNKMLTQSPSIGEHERRMHTKNLPHKCKNCEAKLVKATTLINHKMDKHGAEKSKE